MQHRDREPQQQFVHVWKTRRNVCEPNDFEGLNCWIRLFQNLLHARLAFRAVVWRPPNVALGMRRPVLPGILDVYPLKFLAALDNRQEHSEPR